MLSYNTSLSPSFAESPFPTGRSPYRVYGKNHDDVFRARQAESAAAANVEQAKASADFDLRKQDAERQLVLQGLQQMASAQQNEDSLRNSRLSNINGAVSGLLGGLFK